MMSVEQELQEEEVQGLSDCLPSVLTFLGHDRRALSLSLTKILDASVPINVLGRPALPAKLHYSEPVGVARMGYGSSPMFKIVSVTTDSRPLSRRCDSKREARWDQTVTRVACDFARARRAEPRAGGIVDADCSRDVWIAVLSLLHAEKRGDLLQLRRSGRLHEGCRLFVSFGGGPEHQLDCITRIFLQQIQAIEAHGDYFS